MSLGKKIKDTEIALDVLGYKKKIEDAYTRPQGGGGGGGGSSKFTGLQDTPDNYTGQGGSILQVKDTEDGVEFAESVVKLTGDQTVEGIKTFSSSPVVPAPTTDLQAATKKYVDDHSGVGGADTHVQFNDGSELGGVEGFVFDKSTYRFDVIRQALARGTIRVGSSSGLSAGQVQFVSGSSTIGSISMLNSSVESGKRMEFRTGGIGAGDRTMTLDHNNAVFIANASGTADTSSQLEVHSTTKGFLPPRMTTAQRDGIDSPATGLIIYNTTTDKLNLYDGTSWGAAALTEQAMGTVVHGGTAGTARPSNYSVVTWIGSVEPVNAEDNDVWLDTA